MDQSFIDSLTAGIEYERSRSGPPDDFPSLPTIPGGRYTDSKFSALEAQHLWKSSWLYACHSDEIPEPGSFVLWTRTGSPIVIVRGFENNIHAFYNSCRHRGGPLVKTPAGQVERGFICGFHGWSYDLEGRLKGVRDRDDFVGLEPECLGLVKVQCETLGNWVFINEDPNADSLLDSFGPIPGQIAEYDLENLRHVESYGFEVECNFKILFETFLEVYHLGSVHKETVDRFLDYRGTCMRLWEGGHSLMVTPNRDPDWEDPGTRGMKTADSASEFSLKNNVSYNLFPNLICPFTPTGMPFLLSWPTGRNTMYLECHWFAPDWGGGQRDPIWDTRIANFNRILQEDLSFVPQLQQSVESPGFKGINIGYQERRIYHWHEELDRQIGIENIAETLRVVPRMAPFVEDQPENRGN